MHHGTERDGSLVSSFLGSVLTVTVVVWLIPLLLLVLRNCFAFSFFWHSFNHTHICENHWTRDLI